jgi:NTP pyrophosphatase (non-canonical NTP hydrolase)
MNAESIIEELENICYNNEYILELLSKLKNGIPIRPLPCVRDEHGEMREQTVKQLFAKINGELDELKESMLFGAEIGLSYKAGHDAWYPGEKQRIAEEAADTITAITTMLEALGIDAEMRDEAQRRVNNKNRERGRL